MLTAASVAGAASNGGFGYGETGLPATDGSQLNAPVGQIVGRPVTFTGRLSGVREGDPIEIQRGDGAGNWTTLITAIVAADGRFTATWTPTTVARLELRATPATATVRAASTIPTRRFSVYSPRRATWFGPGFYGNRTHCGQRMTRRLLGVAHKTLRCGTLVEVFYRGRSLTVPVVDRGPFRKHTTYDLTSALAKRLKFRNASAIGAYVDPADLRSAAKR
ncbi:MAG TPA: septal ring lytic transglycosylase RlpA family protein [Baekduia sp.]|nr:septal ring lytic transglycosylase RlpA family protein [Baekduia sp.]